MRMQTLALLATTALVALVGAQAIAQDTVESHVAAAKAAAGTEHTVLFDGLCRPAAGPPRRAAGP